MTMPNTIEVTLEMPEFMSILFFLLTGHKLPPEMQQLISAGASVLSIPQAIELGLRGKVSGIDMSALYAERDRTQSIAMSATRKVAARKSVSKKPPSRNPRRIT